MKQNKTKQKYSEEERDWYRKLWSLLRKILLCKPTPQGNVSEYKRNKAKNEHLV